MAVRNLWSLFNLRESPFFQESLQAGEGPRPIEQLFVGRDDEVRRILDTIGSGGGSSRQAICGLPGVGKSSLAQYIKTQASEDRFLSAPDAVALGYADDTDIVAIRILGYVYEAIVAYAGGEVPDHEAVEDTRQLVRAFRTTSVSGGISTPLGAVSGGRSTNYVTAGTVRPRAVLGDLLRRLAVVVRHELRCAGVIVHLNNLENLSEASAAQAASVLRDLRDPALLADGYHWLLVGTTDAMRAVVFSTDQVRTVVEGPRVLSPLPLDDVFAVLERRYDTLRVDPARAVVAPVTDDVVEELFALCRGDLRAMMAALHVAAHELLSYGREVTSPLTLPDVRAVLRERYADEIYARIGGDVARIAVLAEHLPPGGTFAQKEAAQWWGVGQPETSRSIRAMMAAGYVVEVSGVAGGEGDGEPRGEKRGSRGPRPRWYALGGAARLVFDP